MKKILFLLFVLMSMSLTVHADGLTATLQQGDKMTPYYGVDAFKDAYEAAEDGAVITLSAGTFNTINSIEKSIKIVGMSGFHYNSFERTIISSLSINANRVSIDGIYFSGNVTLGTISDCKISHSWVEGVLQYASTDSWHTNTVVDQCVVKNETAIKQGKNYTIKNSTVGGFTAINASSNIAYITNCYIYNWYDNMNSSHRQPYAIYKNNILDLNNAYSSTSTSVSVSASCEFYNNVFYCSSNTSSKNSAYITYPQGCINSGNKYNGSGSVMHSEGYPNKDASFGSGQDGTPIGITGGTGFSLYPNIPRITSSTIDSNTDSDGKLNVTINVSIPQ